MKKISAAAERFDELLETLAQLRGERGCSWDKEQTHVSLKPSLVEETYETLDAIDGKDPEKLRDELGDLLHQVIFHCQIASERGQFTAEEVVRDLTEKLVRRHPHVFLDHALLDTDAVLTQRARIKADEQAGQTRSSLGNLPKSMPALARAQRITERASSFGFDWPDAEPVWKKIHEELAELKSACATGDRTRMGEEMGDLLLSLVNLSRFLGLQAEDALAQTTIRFIRRFTYIEDKLREAKKTLAAASLEEMDRLWEEAKKKERRESKT